MKLTGREKSSLILEGVVTVVLLVLLNMAIIMIIQDVIQGNPGVTNGIFMIKQSLRLGPNLELPADYHRPFCGD